jgi:hypothetical protein
VTDHETRLREQRNQLVSRYDCGAVPDAIFLVIRQIEIEISWLQHKEENGK